jgi:PAS domain S-box-containing protein
MEGSDSQRLVHRSLLGEAVDGLTGLAVFVWDEDRHYVAVNDAACAVTGLSREQLIGMPVGEMSDDGAKGTMSAARQAPLLTGKTAFTRSDGTRVELDFLTVHTRIAGLPFMASFCWPVE